MERVAADAKRLQGADGDTFARGGTLASVRLAGNTATLIDEALHRIPVVGEVLEVVDGLLGIFGGGDPIGEIRKRLDHEADRFIETFDHLIESVSDATDLEQVARHINRAASAVTDGASLQRIALRLQATMAEKAMAIAAETKRAVGAEMQASIDALETRKTQAVQAGRLAARAAQQAGDRELNEVASLGQEAIEDQLRQAEAMGDVVTHYIARLDALRKKVVAAAKENSDGLGDVAASSRSTEFSKRSSSVSARRPRGGTRTTTVVPKPIHEG